MAVKTSIINGTNINRDHDFSSIISSVEKTGVRIGFDNELAITSGQVDTGMAFISVKRTNVTPNEIFTVPVWVTSAVTGLDTTTVGNFIIIELDQAKINDGSANAVDGTGIATAKSVAALPAENFIELAEITAGPVITDKRSFATIKDNQVPAKYNWGIDSGVADAYIVSIPSSPKAYIDGLRVRFKAVNLNTGVSTIDVNGLGVVPITRNHNIALSGGDIKADQNIELVYNSDLAGFEMQSQVGTSAASDELVKASVADTTADFLDSKIVAGTGITKVITSPGGNEKLDISIDISSQVESETGSNNTKAQTPLRTLQALQTFFDVGKVADISISASSDNDIIVSLGYHPSRVELFVYIDGFDTSTVHEEGSFHAIYNTTGASGALIFNQIHFRHAGGTARSPDLTLAVPRAGNVTKAQGEVSIPTVTGTSFTIRRKATIITSTPVRIRIGWKATK